MLCVKKVATTNNVQKLDNVVTTSWLANFLEPLIVSDINDDMMESLLASCVGHYQVERSHF